MSIQCCENWFHVEVFTSNFAGNLPGDGSIDLKERIRSQHYEQRCIGGGGMEEEEYDEEDEMYYVCTD